MLTRRQLLKSAAAVAVAPVAAMAHNLSPARPGICNRTAMSTPVTDEYVAVQWEYDVESVEGEWLIRSARPTRFARAARRIRSGSPTL